jgi:hypothetical protein
MNGWDGAAGNDGVLDIGRVEDADDEFVFARWR